MTEIKICGITNLNDALFAASCGVEALGFIFYPGSPRCILPEAARTIIAALPSGIISVGVFVNEDAERIREVQSYCGLDMIQLHGDESPAYCRRFPPPALIKAVSPQKGDDLAELGRYEVGAFLIDAREGDRRGGTGLTSDWATALEIKKRHPLVLAGGLKEENIREAIAAVSPRAVDINSGVEFSPGRKDRDRLGRIVGIIRGCGGGGAPMKIFGRKDV